jgi:hypothetical protein
VIAQLKPLSSLADNVAASDKCAKESECLSFRQHLEATSLLLQEYHGEIWPIDNRAMNGGTHSSSGFGDPPTLIMTSESLEMAREFRSLKANRTAQATLTYRFRLVTNDADVTPDTGFLAKISGAGTRNVTFTADEAMLSAMTTIQYQLLPRATVVNCCSNFHVLLADLLAAGCGAASEHALHCLQEHPDPQYQVCCGWFPKCKVKKRLAIEHMELATAASSNRTSSSLNAERDAKEEREAMVEEAEAAAAAAATATTLTVNHTF